MPKSDKSETYEEIYEKLSKSKISKFMLLVKIPGAEQYFGEELKVLNKKLITSNNIYVFTFIFSAYFNFFAERRYALKNIVYGMTCRRTILKAFTIYGIIPFCICSFYNKYYRLNHEKNLEKLLNNVDLENPELKKLFIDYYNKLSPEIKINNERIFNSDMDVNNEKKSNLN